MIFKCNNNNRNNNSNNSSKINIREKIPENINLMEFMSIIL